MSAAAVAFEGLLPTSTMAQMRAFVEAHELGVRATSKSALYAKIKDVVDDGNTETWTYAHRLPDTGAPRDLEDPRCAGLRAECEEWMRRLREASVTESEAKDRILTGAQRHGLVSGKWLLDVATDKAERAWALVATATREGRLGGAAKIANEPRHGKHLILVYADNFGDRDECARLLGLGTPAPETRAQQESARSLAGMGLLDCGPGAGVRRDGFKPDVFTFLGDESMRWRIHCDLLPAMPTALPMGRGRAQCRYGQGCTRGLDCWYDHDS